jgi:hypothetical protein
MAKYGIAKHTLPMLIQNEKSSLKIESRPTDGIENEY